MMTTAEQMTARGAHYTTLLETIDNQGATKLHAREREQLLEAADALLFGEPENRRLLRSAEELIESLEASRRCRPRAVTNCANICTAAMPRLA